MPEIICKNCGEPFLVAPSRAQTASYCSRGCMAEAYARKGAFYVPTSKQEDAVCPQCGESFQRTPSRTKHGRGIYCSPECQHKAISERPSTARLTLTCIGCGETFRRYRSQLKGHKGGGKYCSRRCRDKHRIGAAHPQYLGGKQHRYGPNWQSQKRKAKRRDKHTCQDCGINQSGCVAKCGQGVQVHHIRPFRLFAAYFLANSLANLRTLCPECHREAESAFQRLEREVKASSG